MKYILRLLLSFIILVSCDPLTDEYFIPLLGATEVNIDRVCSNNDLSVFSDGRAVEEYQLSESTYNDFIKRFKDESIPKPNKYSEKFSETLVWKETPIALEDSLITQIPKYMFQKCLSYDQLRQLLTIPGNYYAAYYNAPGFEYFTLFVISKKSKSLYVLQNTW